MASAREWPLKAAARCLLAAGRRADTSSLQAMRRSLTKSEILRKKDDISRVFKKGKSFYSEGMRLIVLYNGLDYDRFLVIPAKHFGNAVQRNKIRRQAKEVFRLYGERKIIGQSEDTGKGRDVVLVVYPGKVSDYSTLESGMVKVLDRSSQR